MEPRESLWGELIEAPPSMDKSIGDEKEAKVPILIADVTKNKSKHAACTDDDNEITPIPNKRRRVIDLTESFHGFTPGSVIKRSIKVISNKTGACSPTSILWICSKHANDRLNHDIDEIDLPDISNQLPAVEYLKDMYTFYRKQQHACRPTNYMTKQLSINADMRSCLVGWLMRAHHKLHLQPETLYLAVYIIDRFLSLQIVTHNQLEILGISALMLATKYEDDWVPEMFEFMYLSACKYTKRDIVWWEKNILNELEWYLSVPTIYTFLVRYLKAAEADEELEHLIYFYGELGLMEYRLIQHCPSLVAASIVYAVRCTLGKSPVWTDKLQQHSSYSETQLHDCAKMLVQAHSTALYSTRKIGIIYKKYMHKQLGAVARYQPATHLIEPKQSSYAAPDA